MIEHCLLLNNTAYEPDNTIGIYFVEGAIGAGKSTLITNNFNDEEFVKVLEPIEEMKNVLKEFYSGNIDEKKASKIIDKLCFNVFYDGMQEAIKSKRSIVIERIPWIRKWIFSYASNDNIDIDIDDKLPILYDSRYLDKYIEYFDKVVFLFIEVDLVTLIGRVKHRDRLCEEKIKSTYIELIRHRIHQLIQEYC